MRRARISLDPGPRRFRSYNHMETIDCRPPEHPTGWRERLQYRPGWGWGPPLRDDLILKPWARALGYRIEHRNGHWHNSATFTGRNTDVWAAGDGWQARARDRHGFNHGPRRVYGDRAFSLFTALLREAPLLLEHHP